MLYFISDMPAPSTHNFIDGFIKRYCQKHDIECKIHCCGVQDNQILDNSVSSPYLKRQGIKRLLNILIAFYMMLFYYKKKDIIIIRNDIFLLFGLWLGTIVTGKKIYYNKSFPFELLLTGIARRFYIFILVFLCNHIAGIIILSTRTQAKLRKLGIRTPSLIIPLAIDERLTPKNKNIWQDIDVEKPQFIYFGTMDNQRGLDNIFNIIMPYIQKHHGELTIIPRYYHEYERAKIKYINTPFHVIPPQDKDGLSNYLGQSHISLCLIPPIDLYLESSPTKFYESLGAGLIVIANREIRQIRHYNHQYNIEELILCDYNDDAMITAIDDAVAQSKEIGNQNYADTRHEYVVRNKDIFCYDRYDESFTSLIKK